MYCNSSLGLLGNFTKNSECTCYHWPAQLTFHLWEFQKWDENVAVLDGSELTRGKQQAMSQMLLGPTPQHPTTTRPLLEISLNQNAFFLQANHPTSTFLRFCQGVPAMLPVSIASCLIESCSRCSPNGSAQGWLRCVLLAAHYSSCWPGNGVLMRFDQLTKKAA